MKHEALAVGLGCVKLRIGFAGRPEDLLPLPPSAQLERMIDGMAGFVPKDSHAPLVLAALDFEHLRFLEPLEPGMSEVERNRDRGTAVRREPLVGQVEVQRKPQLAGVELGAELLDAGRERPFD
jgi:hypothetical protein